MMKKDWLFSPSTDGVGPGVIKTLTAWGLYFGSLNLQEWLQLIGLLLGIGYTATQWWLVVKANWLSRKNSLDKDTDHGADS